MLVPVESLGSRARHWPSAGVTADRQVAASAPQGALQLGQAPRTDVLEIGNFSTCPGLFLTKAGFIFVLQRKVFLCFLMQNVSTAVETA